MSEPIAFRVYPAGRYFYAQVNIWPNKTAMYRHNPLSRNHAASCKGVVRYDVPPRRSKKFGRKLGVFAELHFHLNCLGMEVVTHEMTHAVFCWAERVKLPLDKIIENQNWKQNRRRNETLPTDGPEERFCYAVGVMCNQFVQKCYDMELYEDVSVTKK